MSSDSFWDADDLIPVGQRKISLKANTGVNYSPSQRIEIDIPATHGYILPNETELIMDCDINLPAGVPRSRVQLDTTIGGQVLIKDIRIFSGGAGGILLEEIQDYNVLTNVKYSYDTDRTEKNKRAIREGTGIWSSKSRCTRGCEQSDSSNITSNAWLKKTTGNGTIQTEWDEVANTDQITCKMALPLNTGIFSSNKVFPVAQTQGLRISIQLEGTAIPFRQLDSVLKDRRPSANALVYGLGSASQTPTKVAIGGTINTSGLLFTQENNMTGLENFPFVVGERVKFIDLNTFAANASQITKQDITTNSCETNGTFKIGSIEYLVGAGGYTAPNGLIQVRFGSASGISASVATTELSAATGGDGTVGRMAMYSESALSYPNFKPSYQLSNVELVITEVQMPKSYSSKLMSKMKSGGSMNYDFLSFTNYKYSLQKTDIVANVRLPLQNSRARAILSVPVSAEVYDPASIIACSGTYIVNFNPDADQILRSNQHGLGSIWDNLENYQYNYDGRLQPSREVRCSKISSKKSIEQQVLIENEKALLMSGINPKSFASFQSHAVIGRALALRDGSYDCRGKDFNLMLNYTKGGVEQPFENKLLHNFVAHIRRISMKGDMIQLIV